MAKSKAKHYPPAYYKYRESHPTVSIVLSKDTKDALDKARGEMSYAKFLTSLITPDGVFSQLENQRTQSESQRSSFENEINKQRTQLASEKISFEKEIKKQKSQLASDKVSFEKELKKERSKLKSEWTSLENEILNFIGIERFYVPCSICGKLITIQNTDSNWNSEIKPILLSLFNSWRHIECPK